MTIPIILAALAIVAVTCLVSLMVLFMGGGQAGPDSGGLVVLQLVAVPVSVGIVGFVVALFATAYGRADGLKRIWAAIPQWLVFAYVLINSLTFVGELAIIIIYNALEVHVPVIEHVPFVALFASTTAFLALYARLQADKAPAVTGRWSPPDPPGTRGEPWEDDRW
jgi:hypothetical protein